MIPAIRIANGNAGSITMFEELEKVNTARRKGDFSPKADARFMDFRNVLN